MKLLDNSLGTVKTIFLSKGRYILASLASGLSALFYLFAVVRIAQSNDVWSIVAMCVATFVGTLIPAYVIKKNERDKLYIFDITADTLDHGYGFADRLRASNFAVTTAIVYDRALVKTVLIKVYCSTKDQSKKVVEKLKDYPNFKYNVYASVED